MARINGGDVLARTLAKAGVEEVFALHGGHLDSFLVACPDVGIRLTDTRHEATAGHAADGYARATGGRIGVSVITAGPGFTNAVTPITNAYLDAVPVLFIAGSPPLREVETNPLQGGFDQVAVAEPITKWSHRITNVERIPDLVEKAIRIATTGRPGPVFLEMPIDIMFAPIDDAAVRYPDNFVLGHRSAPPPAAVEALVDMLATAERPVIIAGGGAILSPAAEPLRRFADRSGIPVATSSKANGILPADHPAYVGGAGTLATANLAGGERADAVLLLGARAGLFTGGRSGSMIPHEATLAQVDIDGGEIARLRHVDIPVVGDCAEALEAMNRAADGRSWPDRSKWVDTLQKFRHAHVAMFGEAPKETKPGLLHPYHAAKAVCDALDPETIIVFDGGEAAAWCGHHVKVPGPGLFLGTGYLGCLGVAQGFSIGAARAHPGRPVANFTGDGGLGFNIQEFDTMVRHGLPILTVVMNNACWGMSQHGQDLVFGENRRSAVKLASTDYDRVAAAFGGYGERIDKYDDIGPAVRRAIASGLPSCINLIIDPDVVHPVTPAMVGDVAAKDQIAIPYYENIPQPAE